MPPKKSQITTERMRELHARGVSVREIGALAGLSHPSVLKRLAVDKIRRRDDFVGLPDFTPPRRESAHTSWSLDSIRAARDAQMNGVFKLAVRLAEAMRTDDAIFVARRNRLAPQASIALTLEAHDSARGRAVARKAALGVKLSRTTIASLHSTIVDNAIAIGYNKRTTAEDGTRVDFEHIAWPLEHVRWNPSKEVLETPVRGGVTVPIVHGDGNWTIYRKAQIEPWKEDAAVLPGALVWASHAEGLLDWNATTRTHALAKLIGELPAGVPLQQRNADGSMGLTPEAEMFGRMLGNLMSGASQVGIRPSGSKTEFEANPSTAWQVIDTLIGNREKAAARIFLGTDALLGSQGGGPGVDIAALFAIASPVLQGDFACLENGFRTGVYQPWCAVNVGDSSLAPSLAYQLPDPDLSRKIEENSKKRTAFFDALKAHRDAGMVTTQKEVEAFAKEFSIEPVPQLATSAPPAQKLEIAPTQRALYVKANEARGSDGLQPDAQFGDKTLAQLEAEAKAPPEGAAPPPEPPAVRTRAGKFDESKHSRRDDGKFGSGPGNSAGGSGRKNPKGETSGNDESSGGKRTPDEHVEIAERRVEAAEDSRNQALATHKQALKDFETRKAEVHAGLDKRLADRQAASERAAGLAKEVEGRIRANEEEMASLEPGVLARDKAFEDANPDSDPSERPQTPEDDRYGELQNENEEYLGNHLEDLKLEARQNGRLNRKETERLQAARDAINRGDDDALSVMVERDRLQPAIETEASARWLGDRKVEEVRAKFGGKLDARTEDTVRRAVEERTEYPEVELGLEEGYDDTIEGRRVGAAPGTSFAEKRLAVTRTQRRLERSQRNLQARKKDLIRRERERDADGDGRTGAAEEKDDEQP
jgi:hypothetical protein